MSDNTAIEWTDATWNPVTGCSVKSPGCKHCYAMLLVGTRLSSHPSRAGLTQETKAGPVWTGEVRFNEQWLDQPLHWKRPRRIFVCAHGDLFHEDVPTDWIDRVFAVMALASHHQFQVLTKRSDQLRAYFAEPAWRDRVSRLLVELKPSSLWNGNVYQANFELEKNGFLPNVWLGVSIEDRRRLEERAANLKSTPAAVRYWSAEPLLEDLGAIPVDLLPDWVIVGGESGLGARPMDGDWARRLRDQCMRAGVPFFFKQWGEWIEVDCLSAEQRLEVGDLSRLPGDPMTGSVRLGKKSAGRTLDGAEHSGMPA